MVIFNSKIISYNFKFFQHPLQCHLLTRAYGILAVVVWAVSFGRLTAVGHLGASWQPFWILRHHRPIWIKQAMRCCRRWVSAHIAIRLVFQAKNRWTEKSIDYCLFVHPSVCNPSICPSVHLSIWNMDVTVFLFLVFLFFYLAVVQHKVLHFIIIDCRNIPPPIYLWGLRSRVFLPPPMRQKGN